jgi:hypothetical protein
MITRYFINRDESILVKLSDDIIHVIDLANQQIIKSKEFDMLGDMVDCETESGQSPESITSVLGLPTLQFWKQIEIEDYREKLKEYDIIDIFKRAYEAKQLELFENKYYKPI